MEIEKLNTNTVSDGPGMKTVKNLFKAKLLKHDKWIEGFYVQIEETVYCIAEDYESNPVPIHHMICKTQMTDWGLPNRLELHEIDPKTLCQFTGIKNQIEKCGKTILSVIKEFMHRYVMENIRAALTAPPQRTLAFLLTGVVPHGR